MIIAQAQNENPVMGLDFGTVVGLGCLVGGRGVSDCLFAFFAWVFLLMFLVVCGVFCFVLFF